MLRSTTCHVELLHDQLATIVAKALGEQRVHFDLCDMAWCGRQAVRMLIKRICASGAICLPSPHFTSPIDYLGRPSRTFQLMYGTTGLVEFCLAKYFEKVTLHTGPERRSSHCRRHDMAGAEEGKRFSKKAATTVQATQDLPRPGPGPMIRRSPGLMIVVLCCCEPS